MNRTTAGFKGTTNSKASPSRADRSVKKEKGVKLFSEALRDLNENKGLDPGVAQLLETQFDAFINDVGDFFTR